MSRLLAFILLSSAFAFAAPPVRILAGYHSDAGNTAKMAALVLEGAAFVTGVAVTLRKVADVTGDNIRTSDGIVFGGA